MAKLIAVLFGGLLTQGVWAQQQYNDKEPLLLLKGLEYCFVILFNMSFEYS